MDRISKDTLGTCPLSLGLHLIRVSSISTTFFLPTLFGVSTVGVAAAGTGFIFFLFEIVGFFSATGMEVPSYNFFFLFAWVEVGIFLP